jgi:hypothetical protein
VGDHAVAHGWSHDSTSDRENGSHPGGGNQ